MSQSYMNFAPRKTGFGHISADLLFKIFNSKSKLTVFLSEKCVLQFLPLMSLV